MLATITAYYQAGASIIPLASDGTKRPAISEWNPYRIERCTPDQIIEWFITKQFEGYGVLGGFAGLFMIELEGRAIDEGMDQQLDAIADITSIKPLWERLWSTFIQTSPSGGLHFIIRVDGECPGNLKLAYRKAQDGNYAVFAETRGEGGYWAGSGSAGGVHQTRAPWLTLRGRLTDIATFTTDELNELLDLFRSFDEKPTKVVEPVIAKADRKVGEVLPGDDYADRTTWAEILEPHGWTHLYTDSKNVTHWRRPGKTSGSASATTNYADTDLFKPFTTSTIFDNDQSYSKYAVYAILNHGGNFKEAARQLRSLGYGSEYQANIVDLNPFTPIIDTDTGEQIEDPEIAAIVARYTDNRINWPDLFANAPAEPEWICEPLIERGSLVALAAEAKAGKSLLTLEIAAGLAAGRPVLGNPERTLNTLYVDLENTHANIRQRLDNLGYGPHDLTSLTYYSFPSLPALNSPEGGKHLLALALHAKADLVVIDTLSRVIDGDENDSAPYHELYRHALLHLKGRGIAVLRIDHLGKDASKGMRGSSAKTGDVDAVWLLTASNDTVDLHRTHTRSPHGVDHVAMRRQDDPLCHVVLEDGGDLEAFRRASEVLAEFGLDRQASQQETRDKIRELSSDYQLRQTFRGFTNSTKLGRLVNYRKAELATNWVGGGGLAGAV